MNNIKQSAQAIVAKEIIRGGLVRELCSKCGAQKTVAHHEDYNQPLWVTWLCRKCHGLRHAELNRQNPRRGQEDRTTLVLPAPLVERLDDYWHTKRLNSRPDAIRELLAYALDAKLAKPAKEQRRG